MKRLVLAALLSCLLSACIVVPGRGGPEVVAVPPLPEIVELLDEPFYVQGGYWYYYQGDRWSYGHSRHGPWLELPRDHYPREVRFRNRERGYERGGGEGRGREDRGREDRDRD